MVALRRPASSLPVAVIGVLVAELTLITAIHPPARAGILFGAFILDAVLLTSAALYLQARRLGGFSALRIRWGAILRGVLATGLAGALVARLAGWELPNVALALGLAVEAVIAITILRVVIPALRGRGRGAVFEELRERLSHTLPAPVVRAAIGELELGAAAARALLRRPLPEVAGFSSMRTSQSGFLLPAALLLTLVEAPALHVLIGLWWGPAVIWPHVAIGILNVYGLVWLAADRRLMRESGHRIDESGLRLHLGARVSGHVPWAQMTKVIRLEPGRSPAAQPLTRKVTPYDAPNVHLCLAAPVTLSTYLGLPLRAQHLELFVDAPDNFVAALVEGARAARATTSR